MSMIKINYDAITLAIAYVLPYGQNVYLISRVAFSKEENDKYPYINWENGQLQLSMEIRDNIFTYFDNFIFSLDPRTNAYKHIIYRLYCSITVPPFEKMTTDSKYLDKYLHEFDGYPIIRACYKGFPK